MSPEGAESFSDLASRDMSAVGADRGDAMAGADGYFQVNSADLVRHSGEIDAIGDGLTTACRAADTVRTDVSAYGRLCQVVPALLNGLQQALVDGIAAAADTAYGTADGVRSVAAGYDTTDGDAADRLRNTR